jgi:predicted RNA-binding protein with PUA domain
MVAAKIADMQSGTRTDLGQICTTSQPAAAEMLNVSTRSVKHAKKVQESGDATLIAAVESGEVAVSVAAQHVAAVSRPRARGLYACYANLRSS